MSERALHAEILGSAYVVVVPAGTSARALRRAGAAVAREIHGAVLYVPAAAEQERAE